MRTHRNSEDTTRLDFIYGVAGGYLGISSLVKSKWTVMTDLFRAE